MENKNYHLDRMHEKIDMVYLWCDGNDPEFIERKNKYLGKAETKVKVSGDVRFFDNEELKYSLRSLEMYAPWINHVYIITDRQVPKWLNTEYEKVTVVDHSEIMPKECIPCFNSNVIEYYLPYVPNLSERFLYANDDMFFGGAVTEEDFFDGELPIMRVTRISLLSKIKRKFRNILSLLGIKKYKDYTTTVFNSLSLIEYKYGKAEWISIHHNIDAYSRSSCVDTLNFFKESFDTTKIYRFRNNKCIHRIVYTLDTVYSGRGIMKVVPDFEGLNKIFVGLNTSEVFSYFGKEYHIDRLRKVIKRNKPKLFCLNASEKTTKEIKLEAKKFMEEMFPNPSKFEK